MIRRCSPISILVLICGLLAAVPGCSDPADAIAAGELCTPETDDCPTVTDLRRDDLGRNVLDLSMTHRGDDDQAVSRLRITTGENVSLPESRPSTDDGRLILYEESFAIGSGEPLHRQLGAWELTVVSELRIELTCAGGDCDHRLEYLFLSEPVECVDTDDCSRTEFCEHAYGRCAECLDDTDCDGDGQSCQRETGTCHPGSRTSCGTVADGSPPIWPVALVVPLGLLLMRRSKRRLSAALIAATVLSTVLITSPPNARADTGASMTIGGGMRVLTGEAGGLTGPGWGINVNQQLRWHNVGAAFELSTHSFALDDEAFPDRPRLTGYGISVGPRTFWTLPVELPTLTDDRPFDFVGGLDYTYWNVAENRLASITGLDLSYHAVGPTAGVKWRWGGLELTGRVGYSHIFDWPGGVFSLNLLVGIGP